MTSNVGAGVGDSRPAAQSAGAGGSTKNLRTKASVLTVRGGRRAMKGYTVTHDELGSLGYVQLGSSLSFTIGGSALGFWLSTKQAVELAGRDTDPLIKARWDSYSEISIFGALFFLLLACALLGFGRLKVHSIMKETIHE